MKSFWIFPLAALALVGCNNDQGVPGRDDRVQTGQGTPGATPNQSGGGPKRELTVTNSSQQTSVPREGGNLDRGVTRDNDPARNAPGPDGKALNQSGSGAGPETR